jgi:hypothetical protein
MRSTQALGLYRRLMRAAGAFHNYNFREYALRRVRLGFHENKVVADSATASRLLAAGEKELETVRRQATISMLYQQARHVLEPLAK